HSNPEEHLLMLRTARNSLAGLFLLIMTAVAQSASPQASSPTNHTLVKSADLEMDATVLRKAYEELHPGLYRYSTKAEMDAKFEALQKTFSHDLSLQDAY